MSGRGYHCLFPVFTQADAECENTGGGRLEGARSRSMPSLSSLVSSFVALLSTFPPFFDFRSSSFHLILQPSSPGDYYSSVDSDLKVELTEKLFALDTEGGGASGSTEVNVLTMAARTPLFSGH